MDTRVSLQSIVQGALADTRRLSDQLAALQGQATTGKRFASISDDPESALRVLHNDTLAQSYDAHVANIRTATSRLDASVATLQQVGDVFTQARSIAIEAANSVNDATSFETLAQSVDALLDRLLNLANTQQQDGVYVFSGTAARTKPFAVTATDAQGRPTGVQYMGADESSAVFVDRARQVALDYSGAQIFQTRSRQATTFSGNTGARPGAGTDSATLRGKLSIQHTATTFAPGSGVQPGTSSAAGDTILGPAGAHRLHIVDTSGNGSAGTISLDGGPAVAFTSSDTNLAVTSASGETVYLDTTAITPNFAGDIDITANGVMSIDGGATTVPLTYAPDQMVADSATGKVTFVDTSGVTRTGIEKVAYAGTADAFQALIALRDDLRNTRHLSDQDRIQAISANLDDLNRVHNNVLATVGGQSATLHSLESLKGHLQDLQLNARKAASDLGDVDMSELVVKLQANQNMLQLSLAAFARIVGQNLLDFLR